MNPANSAVIPQSLVLRSVFPSNKDVTSLAEFIFSCVQFLFQILGLSVCQDVCCVLFCTRVFVYIALFCAPIVVCINATLCV